MEKTDESIAEFHKKLVENQKDLPPEFQKVLDDHFWELLEE